MFSDFFTILWENILALLASILPSSQGLPSNISTALTFFVNQANTLNYIFPIGVLFQILVYVVSVEIALFFFKIVITIVSFVRGN